MRKLYEVTAMHIDMAGEYDYTLFSRFFRKFKNALLLKRRIKKVKFDDDTVIKIICYTKKEIKDLKHDIKIQIID